MLCTSGFVGDGIFFHNGPDDDMSLPMQQRRCSAMNKLTPVLRRIGYVGGHED